ncbi:MAG: hypothetical protein AAGF13_10980, partial [Pseudomonadota bacterium]
MSAMPARRPARFLDHISVNRHMNTDIVNGFVGRRLRANRLSQCTLGVTEAASGIDHTLVFHISGGRATRVQGGKVTGRSTKLRTATLIPAFSDASWDMPENVEVLHLYLDDHDLRRFGAQEYDIDPDKLEMRDLMCVDDRFMRNLAPVILDELQSELPKSRLLLDGFDAVVAGHMLRAFSNMADVVLLRDERDTSQSDLQAVTQARDYLLDNLSTNMGLEALAAQVGLSPFRLMRKF